MHEENKYLLEVLDNIDSFIRHILSLRPYVKHKSKLISQALYYAETGKSLYEEGDIEDFIPDDPKLLKQWELIQSVLQLHTTLESIKDVEFYFRRYPFKNKEIDKCKHFKYMSEMLNYRVYEFKEKLEKTLTHIKRYNKKSTNIDIKKIMKEFRGKFEYIIGARNYTAHKGDFNFLELDSLTTTNLLSLRRSADSEEYKEIYNKAYRRECKNKIKEVRNIYNATSMYLEIVCRYMLVNCDFLQSGFKYN